MVKKQFSLFILIIITGHLFAQFSEEYTRYKALYPDADKVRLNTQTNINIEIVDGELLINLDY